MSKPVLVCKEIRKSYVQAKEKIEILRGINLTLNAGETLAIVGASGSGKSTLLNILGALDLPEEGSVEVSGQNIAGLSENELSKLRNKHIGFVYQFHHLLPEFSALENVAMPLMIRGVATKEAKTQANYWLERVGLGHRVKHKSGQLSGGERQRVAIARALAPQPSCVLMDEPTGNLDPDTANAVQALLWELVKSQETSFALVTHDPNVAANMDRTLVLSDGILTDSAQLDH